MTRNQKRAVAVLGLGTLFAIVAGLVLVAILAAGGAGWYYMGGDETEEVAAIDEETTEEEEVIVEDEEVATGPSWTESATQWWNEQWWSQPDVGTSDGTVADGGNDEPDDSTSDGTATTSTAPPTASSAAPIIVKGIKPYGNAFPAPGKSGAVASTLTVVIGDVPKSARSQAGEMETFWGQGVEQNPVDGTLREIAGRKQVIDPDVIRSKVGINTTWTSLPGYTGVSFTCKVIQAENGDSPAGCSRPPTTHRVAAR